MAAMDYIPFKVLKHQREFIDIERAQTEIDGRPMNRSEYLRGLVDRAMAAKKRKETKKL